MEGDSLERAIDVLSSAPMAQRSKFLLRGMPDWGDETSSDIFPPEDLTEESVEKLKQFLRYVNSVPTVFSGAGGPSSRLQVWAYLSPESYASLLAITEAASPLSEVSGMLGKYLESSRVFGPFAEEIRTALSRGGWQVSYDEVYRCLQDSMQSPLCLLVERVYSLLVEAFRGDQSSILHTEETLRTLLECKVAVEAVPMKRASAYPADCLPRMHMYESGNLSQLIERELSAARANLVPVLITVLMICDEILEYQPYGSLSALMELVIRSALFYKVGLPGLIGVPLSTYALQWEQMVLPPGLLVAPLGTCTKKSDLGFDVTLFFEQRMRFCQNGLADLERLLRDVFGERDQVVATVRNDGRLNYRQQQAIIEAIGNRLLWYDAALYQRQFGVTAPTARSDLGGLCSFGFFNWKMVKNRRVYTLRPDFKDALVR